MSRPRVKLPLPSVCTGCGTTIHAIRTAVSRKEKEAIDRVLWVHDASVFITLRKGGPHAATPTEGYAPPRAREVLRTFGRAVDLPVYRRHIQASVLA